MPRARTRAKQPSFPQVASFRIQACACTAAINSVPHLPAKTAPQRAVAGETSRELLESSQENVRERDRSPADSCATGLPDPPPELATSMKPAARFRLSTPATRHRKAPKMKSSQIVILFRAMLTPSPASCQPTMRVPELPAACNTPAALKK